MKAQLFSKVCLCMGNLRGCVYLLGENDLVDLLTRMAAAPKRVNVCVGVACCEWKRRRDQSA